MNESPNALHLVEKAARRLLEADDPTASQLLRRSGPLKLPGSGPAVDVQAADPGPLVPAPPGAGDAATYQLLRQLSSGAPSNAPAVAGNDPLSIPPVDVSRVTAPLKQPSGGVAPAQDADPSLRKPDLGKPDLLRQAGLKPGSIEAAALKSAGMIDWNLNHERLSEEFRIVQGQVRQALVSVVVKPPALANLLMLTSAKPGEGKTFSSLNLAGSLASCSPQTVILVDVDTKRHALTTRLRLQTRPGLLDVAFNPHTEFSDVLVGTSLPNLRVLPIGRNEMQASLSGGKPIIHVLERLGRAFADCLIVLDTPPCLSSSDPSTLAPFVAAVVMLIEAQQTQRAEVEAALDLVEACPTAMLMLNKVQLTGSDTFGAYGY